MSKKSIKKNYVYNVIYQLLLIIIPIVVTPYVSRVLDPAGIGEYSFSYSLITYFTIFASLGFGVYAQREIAKYQDDPHRQSIIFWEINICRLIPVMLSLIVNIILVFSGVYGKYADLMLLFCINIVAVALDIAFFFQGNEEFGKVVLINVVIKVLGTIGIFVLVKNPNHVWIYALLNSLILIVSNLSIWFFLRKKLVKIKLSELKPLRHLPGTIRLFIPTLATSIYMVLDKSLIGFITHTDAENGFYEQAEKIVKMATMIITCLGTVMTSRNTYELERGNIAKVQENNYKALHFVWLLGLPLTTGIVLTANNLVPWFLGPNFDKSILLMQVLAALVLILGISNVIGLQYLLPYKKDRQFTFAVAGGAIINLCLNIPFIYLLGALGAAVVTIITESIVTITMLFMAAKHLSIWRIFKMAVKPLLASVVMSIAVFPLSLYLAPSILNTFILAGVGLIVYGIMILLLRDELLFSFLRELKNKFFTRDGRNVEVQPPMGMPW